MEQLSSRDSKNSYNSSGATQTALNSSIIFEEAEETPFGYEKNKNGFSIRGEINNTTEASLRTLEFQDKLIRDEDVQPFNTSPKNTLLGSLSQGLMR